MKKIETQGNYFILTDVTSGISEIERPMKNISYRDSNNRINFYETEYNQDIGDVLGYGLGDLVDGTGTPFTDYPALILFLRENTGNFNGPKLTGQIIINQANVGGLLSNPLDSTKMYLIDGVIDIGTYQFVVPAAGLQIKGLGFDVSKICSSEDNHIMFISPIGGSGNLFMDTLSVECTGVNSKVYNLIDVNGFNAVECNVINYNNCTSLGTIKGYRQMLELNSGRFGGSPSLTLDGTWLGGYRIETSITRGISDTTTEPLFKAGPTFIMNSRFKTNMNVDLGSLQPFVDFSSTNFPNPSTLQLQGCEITRDGLYNPNDTNITPNISSKSLSSLWVDNNGISNTYIGGLLSLTTEVVTPIITIGAYVPLSGTYTASDLQHFDTPANGQLRNLGRTPREFKIITYIVLDGSANDMITIRLRKYNSTTLTTTTIVSQSATVNNFSGANDRCTFSILGRIELDKNDYYFIDVANMTSTDDVTSKIGTFTTIERR